MPNFGGSRLGFWHLQRGLFNACDVLPTYLPNISTGEMTGLTEISQRRYEIQNQFLKVSLNGNLRGAIGSGGVTPNLGIRYDPSGTSNFNIDEFIERGSVHEGFGVEVSGVGGSREDRRAGTIDSIRSGNELGIPAQQLRANAYSLGTNHYLFKLGNSYAYSNTKDISGIATVQYKLLDNEPVIRIKMTYTNTTTQEKFIRMFRALDPDQDVSTYSSYKTNNSRGYDNQPITDLVYALGARTGKAISIYIPGNGYTHNTNILSSWPTYNPDKYFFDPPTPTYSYPIQNTEDHAIGAVWKIGIVQPGQSVVVCCYYIFGNNVDEIVDRIEGRG